MAAGMEKLNFYLIFEKMSFFNFIFGCAGLSLVASRSCSSCRAQAPLVAEHGLQACEL